MKFTNKILLTAILVISLLTSVTGCGRGNYSLAYVPDSTVAAFRMFDHEDDSFLAEPFATELCVVSGNTLGSPALNLEASGAALFDLSGRNAVYAKNVYEKLYPASLTKILTALVALKHGSMDQLITANDEIVITESGAQLCGLKPGDQLTLSQAMHLMLINSANDAAVAVAVGVGGSVERFAEMMNQEALALGATNSHFVNPHGLSDDNHYTTVYDIYLILQEALKYEAFNQIIQMSSYTTTYTTAGGDARELSVNSTNLYIRGVMEAPVTVLGGKTGTTNAAGHCLALVSKDTAGNPFISVIMRADSQEGLYGQMTDLLGQINK